MPKKKAQYPEVLTYIATEAVKLLVARGMNETEALAFGFELTEGIRRRWGGEQVYVPKGFSIVKRNAEIAREFNGDNVWRLAAKYGLTTRHVRDIIKAEK